MKLKVKYKIQENSEKSILSQILENREVKEEWLTAGAESLLDGGVLKNFDRAYQMIHKNKDKKIGILADKDPDGFCSTALTYLWLNQKFGVEPVIIMVEGKVHGIIENAIPEDIEFLIVPDASTNEIEVHERFAARGVDILIMDHHEFTREESPFAVVVNPQNPNCPYENKNLSGAGVVYKVIEAIDKIDGVDFHSEHLDLVAFSIVADVMDLRKFENKALVNLGLSKINNRFIKAVVMADQRVKDKSNITAFTVGFYLNPPINATIRVGSLEEQISLIRAMVGLDSAETVVANMMKLKRKQDTGKEPVILKIVMALQKTGGDKLPIIMAQTPTNTHKSVTGLIAGQLASMYNRPTFLSSRMQEGVASGSARTVNNSTVENLKDFCEESGLFDWVAGHQGAFGWQMKESNIPLFMEYCKENLPPFDKVYYVDFALEEVVDRASVIHDACELKNHFGPGFPELLVSHSFRATPELFSMCGAKNNTLRFSQDGISYIMFNTKLQLPENEVYVKIVGKPDLNDFNGRITPQIKIEDIQFQTVL